MRSSPCIGAPPRRLTRGFRRAPDCRCFFGDIDPDRAPGDAATTADATRTAELIDPVGQLVGYPLAVAGAPRTAHAAAVNIEKIHRETGVPAPNALGKGAGNIGRVIC